MDDDGRKRITISLLRYGYHGPYALTAVVEEDMRESFWREYVADTLCLLAQPYCESTLTFYSELMRKEKIAKPLTTDEIIDGVLDKLTKIAG